MLKKLLLQNEIPVFKTFEAVVHLPPCVPGYYFMDETQFQYHNNPYNQEFISILGVRCVKYPAILIMTNYRILLFEQLSESYYFPRISIPYGLISKCEKIGGEKTSAEENYGVSIELVSPLFIKISIDKKLNIRKTFFSLLEKYLEVPNEFNKTTPSYMCTNSSKRSGYYLYNPFNEAKRMNVMIDIDKNQCLQESKFCIQRLEKLFPNVEEKCEIMGFLECNPHFLKNVEYDLFEKSDSHDDNKNIVSEEQNFRLTSINYNYSLCETYPAFLIFPISISNEELMVIAQFRSSERLCTIIWTKESWPCICRCSEPLQGLNNETCEFDKKLLSAISTKEFPGTILVDARPSINVKVNELMGKGVEKISEYETIERVVYLNMENIHVIRSAFNGLRSELSDYIKEKYAVNGSFVWFNLFFNKNEKQNSKLQEEKEEEADMLKSTVNKKDLSACDDEILQANEILENIFTLTELSNISMFAGDTSTEESELNESIVEKTAIGSSIRSSLATNDVKDDILIEEEISEPLILNIPVGSSVLNAINEYIIHKHELVMGALVIEKCILEGRNVIIHCSDGWDRTPQLSAYSQILLDPYFRTVEGFAILIQKEFISLGHRFGTRCDNFKYVKDDKEESPIFFIFIEAVSDLVKQNQDKFEFNQDYLLYLAFETYNREYGDFMFDCECDRSANELTMFTNSVFDNINKYKVREIDVNSKQQLNMILEEIGLWWEWWGEHLVQ